MGCCVMCFPGSPRAAELQHTSSATVGVVTRPILAIKLVVLRAGLVLAVEAA